MAKELIVRSFYPDTSKTSAQLITAYDLAQEQKAKMARISLEFNTICNNTRGGANSYTYLDEIVELCIARGINKFLFGLTYAKTGGTWDCTNVNTLASFSANDRTALVAAQVATVDHLLTIPGVTLDNCIFPLWNEAGRTTYGAASTSVFSATQKALFNASVAALRAAYPTIQLGTPIFSVSTSTGWSDVTVANIQTAGVLETYMSAPDFILYNHYPGIVGEVPVKGVGAIRRVTRRFHEAFTTAIAAADVGGVLAAKQIIIPESGLTYINAGQRYVNSGVSYYHGGAEDHSDYVMAQVMQLMAYERVEHVARYQLINGSAPLDSLDDTDNYGDCLYNNGTDFQRTALFKKVAALRGVSAATLDAMTLTEPS